MYEENDFNPDTDEMLQELMSLLGSIPKNTVTMLDIPKYADAIRSITQIIKFVKEDFPEAEANIAFDELTGTTLILTIVTEGVNVYAVKDFCSALSVASTMDIVPLNDGKVQIGFAYRKVKIPVPPASN